MYEGLSELPNLDQISAANCFLISVNWKLKTSKNISKQQIIVYIADKIHKYTPAQPP